MVISMVEYSPVRDELKELSLRMKKYVSVYIINKEIVSRNSKVRNN